MGNGICHLGDINKQEVHSQQDKNNYILELPNSYAKSPSKPTIETQNPTISLNHEDCYDILLTSSLEQLILDKDQCSMKKHGSKESNKYCAQPNSLRNEEAQNMILPPELQLIYNSRQDPKPILKICEQLKSNQSKKKVRFDDED